jgi:hypothetical protein
MRQPDMVMGEKLARGLVKRQNRNAHERINQVAAQIERCLEGKTKRSSRYRALQDLFNELYSGRTLQMFELNREGYPKDAAFLWISADHGEDPETGEKLVIIVLTLVKFRDPTDIWMHEAIVFTHHAAQRLLQSTHCEEIYEAVAATECFAEVAFELFKTLCEDESTLGDCKGHQQLILIDQTAGWMPAEFHGDHVVIKTVIAPDALNPGKRRTLDEALAQENHWICYRAASKITARNR